MLENEIKIDKLDRKILTELDDNSRQSLSVLSKKLKRSRSVIDYKIRRLEKRGIIQNYVILLDPGKLGLMIWNIYLEFENTNTKVDQDIATYIKNHPKVWWAAKTAGRWNFVFSVVIRNVKELEFLLNEFSEQYGRYIQNQSIVAHGEVDIISRGHYASEKGRAVKWFSNYNPRELTNSEREILSVLGTNARINLVDLASKSKLAVKTAATRLKELERDKVIVRYRLQSDVTRINMQFYKAILYLKNSSKENETKLLNYCIELGNVFHFERKIGPWPLELKMESRSYEECENILYKMKEDFGEYIKSYEILLIKEEVRGELDLTKFI